MTASRKGASLSLPKAARTNSPQAARAKNEDSAVVPKSTPANDNRSPAVADIVNTTWAGSRPETTRQLANFLVEEALHAIRAKLQRNRASGADLVP